MRYKRRIAIALVVSVIAAQSAFAQFFRRPVVPVRPISPVRPYPYIDTSWQNNPYVYWTIHHHGMPYPYPYPPRPYTYPVPYPMPLWCAPGAGPVT
jgi:hypothetical protein